MIAIVLVIAAVALGGTIALMRVSPRLRDEIEQLLAAFDRTERTVTPLVATVMTDRQRLAQRLAELHDGGSDPTRR